MQTQVNVFCIGKANLVIGKHFPLFSRKTSFVFGQREIYVWIFVKFAQFFAVQVVHYGTAINSTQNGCSRYQDTNYKELA
jgi:hypothetical protein